MPPLHASRRSRGRTPHSSSVSAALLFLLLLLLSGILCCATPAHATEPHSINDATTPTSLDDAAERSSSHQTSVLNRLWWRSLAEQDTFIQSLFRKPLARANIGGTMLSATAADSVPPPHQGHSHQRRSGRSEEARSNARAAHHAPANSTGPERSLFIPKLNLVYTMTAADVDTVAAVQRETRRAAEAALPPHLTESAVSYTQMLRSVLPRSFGGVNAEAEEQRAADRLRPLSPLEFAAIHSPITPLRLFTVEDDADAAATNAPAASIIELDATTAGADAEGEVQPVDGSVQKAAMSSPVLQRVSASTPTTAAAAEAPSASYYSPNSAEETLVIVSSSTKAIVPLTIVGTSYTIVQFDGKAGNTINAVIQLKDSRYDPSISSSNCANMYFKIELRNHVHVSTTTTTTTSTASPGSGVEATTQPHAYIDPDTWAGVPAAADASSSDEGPDVSGGRSGGWATFWESFALMFDNSALCKVLPSVSMRVNRAPKSEPYYVVLRSTTGYTYENAYYYNTTSGSFYYNTDDDGYKCRLDVFIEQAPAAEQEWLQFLFAFLVPLLVLLLPLPFTMRRADLIQQYMMDTDYADWVWRPPYVMRNKMLEGLKAIMNWCVGIRTAYQQRALLAQLQQQQQQPVIEGEPPTGNAPARLLCTQEYVPHREAPAHGAPSSDPLPSLPPPPQHRTATSPAPPPPLPVPLPSPSRKAGRRSHSTGSFTSSRSRSEHSSTSSDFEETADGQLCSRSCTSNPGAVSPPQKSYAPGGHGALVTEPLDGSTASAREDGLPTSGTNANSSSNNRGKHRFGFGDHHRCQHRHRDGAGQAVSVHVPYSGDSPVVTNSRRGDDSVTSAHQLLFTIPEVVGASPDGAATTATAMGGNAAPCASGAAAPREILEAAAAGCPDSAGAATTSSCNHSNGSPKKSSEEEEEEPFCRICREGSEVEPLITPCACTGSVRFVHATCLDRWRLESAKRNLANVNHCEICKEPFTVNIQRSTLIWESSQHILRGVCLFFTCVLVIVLTTTLTHVILGELSCLASYHEVAYGTMFRFEGLSLSLFVYGLAVLLVLFANLIVYSWFRSRTDVEEYVQEMHLVPPFYTRRNTVLIVFVSLLLLAQVHAMGFLLKYFLYNTSHLVWSWETSPLVGGMLFALFMTCSITVCSWARLSFVARVLHRGEGAMPASDVVVEGPGQAAQTTAPTEAAHPAQTPARVHGSASAAATEPPAREEHSVTVRQADATAPQAALPAAGSPAGAAGTVEDATYTRHFEVPPEQRVIRAFEYCPPRRKLPKW